MSGIERSQRGRAYPMLGRRHAAKRRSPRRVVSAVTFCPAPAMAFGVAQPVAATMIVPVDMSVTFAMAAPVTFGVSASTSGSSYVAVTASASTCPSATFSPALTATISVTVSTAIATAIATAVTPFCCGDIVGNRQSAAIYRDGAGKKSGDYGYRCDQAGGAAAWDTVGVISIVSADCFSHGSPPSLQAWNRVDDFPSGGLGNISYGVGARRDRDDEQIILSAARM